MLVNVILAICTALAPRDREKLVPVEKGPKYTGMCDASAAAPVGTLGFVVANDEDNVLRVYRRDKGGKAVVEFDLDPFLVPDPKQRETDIEGATWLNKKIFWITSHGRNRDAEMRTSRHRLFATEFVTENGVTKLRAVGSPYRYLVVDMLRSPKLAKYQLGSAVSKAPKDDHGFNIEGLTYTPDGRLWVGLRNPIPAGRALIVPLENPEQIIRGQRARIGNPIELNLGNHGVRSIEYIPELKKYLIVAGPHNNASRLVRPGQGKIAVYVWTGQLGDPPQKLAIQFKKTTPEAFVVYRDRDSKLQVQFFSDDGTRKVDGKPCKENKSRKKRGFRSRVWDGLTNLVENH